MWRGIKGFLLQGEEPCYIQRLPWQPYMHCYVFVWYLHWNMRCETTDNRYDRIVEEIWFLETMMRIDRRSWSLDVPCFIRSECQEDVQELMFFIVVFCCVIDPTYSSLSVIIERVTILMSRIFFSWRKLLMGAYYKTGAHQTWLETLLNNREPIGVDLWPWLWSKLDINAIYGQFLFFNSWYLFYLLHNWTFFLRGKQLWRRGPCFLFFYEYLI